jgi:hypothetical protein
MTRMMLYTHMGPHGDNSCVSKKYLKFISLTVFKTAQTNFDFKEGNIHENFQDISNLVFCPSLAVVQSLLAHHLCQGLKSEITIKGLSIIVGEILNFSTAAANASECVI